MSSDGWGDDVDAALEQGKIQRFFKMDTTFQTHFCKRCSQPTAKYDGRGVDIDSGGHEIEESDDLCARCLGVVLSKTSVGCDE